jgi:hypothetical protein
MMPEKMESIHNINITQVPELLLQTAVEHRQGNFESKLNVTREFLKENMKNALTEPAMPTDIARRVWDQSTGKTLSEVLELKYGVCLDYHVVAAVLLSKLNIQTLFQTGEVPNGPKHTYLDVLNPETNQWEIFDPFAEDYLKANGSAGKTFQNAYYTNSKTRQNS